MAKKPETKQQDKPQTKKQDKSQTKKQDKPQTLTIDGAEYNAADLSEGARNHVMNLRVTDQEIARLQQQLAIYQTARTAYAQALSDELPKAKH